MRVRILGPVEISDNDDWHPVTAGRCRAVLGSLVARAPHPVAVDEIIDDVWQLRPPGSAPTQVYGYVRKLRSLLGDRDGTVLSRTDAGYVLSVGSLGVDAHRFETTIQRGLDAFRTGRLEESRGILDEALATWRGEPFHGVPPGARALEMAVRLEKLRLAAVEHRLQARIDCGEHAAVIGDIQDQVSRHPFHEHLWRQLLVALYRSGREAEALHEYDRLRRTLADELGTDPSQATREVYQQILDRSLPHPPHPPVRVSPAPTAPIRQLPPGVPDFAGRATEVATLAAVLREHDAPDAPAVVVVSGAPGTGKSTLALHLARSVRTSYPDAHFHLNLAGTSPSPREPAELLATMLHGLGRFGHPLPESVDARAALLRSMLADRRTLLVLDDAAHAAQVLPLLPPNGESSVIVTSRHTLTDLPGARHLHLGALDPGDAEDLLATIVGGARVAREPAEARAIVRLCGYLPLSIRIAGGKLVGRPCWPLRELRVRLADESRRLAELSLGDLDVRASVDLSLRALPADAALGFDLLGLLGPNDQPGWVLGALVGQADHEPVMDRLLDAGLVQLVRQDAAGQARYRMHDLLRVYAYERAVGRGREICRQAADRVVRQWTRLVEAVRRGRPPSMFDALADERPVGLGAPSDDVVPGLTEPAALDASTWLAGERHALLDAVRLGRDWALAAPGSRLAGALAPLYDERALHDDWRTSHEVMLTCGGLEPVARAALQRGLAQVMIYADEFEPAADHLRDALRAYESAGHAMGSALALAGLGTIHRFRGDTTAAEECLRRALATVVAADDPPKEALLRGAIGRVLVAQGRLAEARPWYDAALRLARHSGDGHREAVTLRDLGSLEHGLGRPAAAIGGLQHAVRLFRELRDERCVALTLLQAGAVLIDLGDHGPARAALTEAGELFGRCGLWDEADRCRALLRHLCGEVPARVPGGASAPTPEPAPIPGGAPRSSSAGRRSVLPPDQRKVPDPASNR
ncbi:AfsR/SARP family transcriptional regulator [Promicromonospora aerolata]|uniref:BTAD domain-containing putative transcriptional regulator n=1 Tax=Promicromonospora aerolata TaxID=195749 RepID=A0ABW4V2H4_9MICO